MKNINSSIAYIICAGLNTLHFFFFALISLLFTYQTDKFLLTIGILILFFIVNLIIYGFLYKFAVKSHWNLWINLIVSTIVGVVYLGALLISCIIIVFPEIEKLDVY